MTTQIAVLNPLGVALATDSAAIANSGGAMTVFNSVDKLFELSRQFPVALMFNGSCDCFDVPWELLIKDFRDSPGAAANKSIRDWAQQFMRFVEARQDFAADAAQSYVKHVTETELFALRKEATTRVWASQSGPLDAEKKLPAIIAALIAERRKQLGEIPAANSLEAVSDDEILAEYSELFKSSIETLHLLPSPTPEELERSLRFLLVDALRAMVPGDFSTGLIVAGYGDGDNYPSVASIDVGGYVKGRLKYSAVKHIASIASPEFGHAASFAQTDVIERLLSGADPSFIEKTAAFLFQAAERLAPLILDACPPKTAKQSGAIDEVEMTRILHRIREEYVSDAAPRFQREFREDFERTIALMPKQELIELAEALISITAIERKATASEAAVGGPTDVAFITKHEGFVWIKRKHYFEAGLNPGYFWRKYGLANSSAGA
jgi:20S proteasome alpha/beta subunit